MLKETFVRQSAHNLSERIEVQDALKERSSKPRKEYLKGRLRRLNRERDFFLSIKDEFIITPSDCYRI
jgi:hypothetical protein